MSDLHPVQGQLDGRLMLQLCSLVLYNTMIALNFLQACQEDRHA